MAWPFFHSAKDVRYGAIVDIGSGSVGVAVVRSDVAKKQPELIWTHREQMVMRKHFVRAAATKQIRAAVLNAFLELGNSGLRALCERDPQARINEIQVSLAAPWCYTITDTIRTGSDSPVEVDKKMMKGLFIKAKKKAEEVLDEQTGDELDLTSISMSVIDVTANGYHISDPEDKLVNELSISIVRGYGDKQLIEAVKTSADKVLPQATVDINTFMFTYYETLKDLAPDTTEVCLIDITNEATELGVVREGVLEHVTHMPFGTNSLAREVAEVSGVPNDEARGYLLANGTDLSKRLSAAKQDELAAVISTFEEKLAKLLRQTGDQLSIPKTIFIHSDDLTGQFFTDRLKNAAHQATGSTHRVHHMSAKFFPPQGSRDTAILLSAYVFHKNLADISNLDL